MPTDTPTPPGLTSDSPLPPPTELRERGQGRPDLPVDDVVQVLGGGGRTSVTENSSALEWFLSEAPEDSGADQKVIEINVGTDAEERWIKWTIRPVDSDSLRRIQKISAPRRGKEDVAADMVNLRVVVAGTVVPDLGTAARQMDIADPAMAVRMRFAFKPGLVTQLAGKIMELSGFDDEDVREAAAAGN